MAEPRPTALDLRLDGLISISGNTTIHHGSIFHSTVPVIVKEIAYEEISTANQALREAMVQKRLEHPNVCKLYDCYLQREGEEIKVVMVMERLESDLKAAIDCRKREGRLWKELELLQICKEMVSALAYAETCGIAHRDIKPENIFFDRNRYKLGDFGASISVSLHSLPSSLHYSNPEHFNTFLTSRSQENSLVHPSLPGNLRYSSPEYRQAVIQAVSQGSVQAEIDFFRADVYSLGLVLMEMALLEFPEEAKDVLQLESRLPACVNRVIGQYSGFLHILPVMLAVSPGQRLRFTGLGKLMENAEKREISTCKVCGKVLNGTDWIGHLDPNLSEYRGKCAFLCSEQCLRSSLSDLTICVGCGEQYTSKEAEFVSFPCPSKHIFHNAECLFQHICTLTKNFSDPGAAYTCPCCQVRVIKEEVTILFESSVFELLKLEAYQNSCCLCHQSTDVWKCKRGHVLCKAHQYTVFWKTKCPICNNKTRLLTA